MKTKAKPANRQNAKKNTQNPKQTKPQKTQNEKPDKPRNTSPAATNANTNSTKKRKNQRDHNMPQFLCTRCGRKLRCEFEISYTGDAKGNVENRLNAAA